MYHVKRQTTASYARSRFSGSWSWKCYTDGIMSQSKNEKIGDEVAAGAAFAGAYAALNPEQKRAVDTIDGPVMVIAGPGTGKTQILTLRIANILLKTDTVPESILALTFTESGAKAMRERLHRYIGARAYQVPIYTFHGFAGKLIKAYPEAYERIIGGRPATDIEKIVLIETILDNPDIKLLRPSGNISYYVRPIERILGELKKEYVTPDAFVQIIATQEQALLDIEQYHVKGAHKGKERGDYTKAAKVITKNRELLFVYRQYEASLRAARLYDFEDMIAETVIALETQPDMLRDLQEQYQYILADEHQDVNGAQNRILESLASYHDSPNIFVVGDEKQAIYRFQGASLENFLYFGDRFLGTTTIALTENYRSGQAVLDVAHSLVKVDAGPLAALRVPLSAAVVPESIIERRSFSHQAIEDEWVVQNIKAAIEAGVSPAEIAVIVRSNREVETYTSLLRQSGITVEASADGDILTHPITLAVEALMSAVLLLRDEAALFVVLHGAYWGLSIPDVVKITRARSFDTSLFSILENSEKLQVLAVENISAAKNIATVIATARTRMVSEAPHRVLQYLLQASGFLRHVTIHNPVEGERVVRRLYDEVESMVVSDSASTLGMVRDILAQRRAYNLPLSAPYIATNTVAVQVMTAHKSKGLEFSQVYIPHLQDSIWGGGRHSETFIIPLSSASDTPDAFNDELRLLYVAITRAKTAVYFSSAEMSATSKALVPTRFFDVLDETLVSSVSVSRVESLFSPLASLMQRSTPRQIDTDFILQSLTTKGFSATSFNNCVANPWNYVYRNVLRIPEVQATHLQFGTAIHAVLESATKYHTTHSKLPNATFIKNKLEVALARLPFSTNEFVRHLELGLTMLYPYLEHVAQTLPAQTVEELTIKVLLPTGIPELPMLPLTGNLDRLDIGTDGRAYRVVDYKTGKPKTRNDIEGKTASSDGAYKRQLVFYTLLLSLYGDARYLTNTGVLSFVQSAAKGSVKEEMFTINAQEVAALRLQIIETVGMLLRGDFLTDSTLAAESKYAELARALIGRMTA